MALGPCKIATFKLGTLPLPDEVMHGTICPCRLTCLASCSYGDLHLMMKELLESCVVEYMLLVTSFLVRNVG
jgi:hypothetical protein